MCVLRVLEHTVMALTVIMNSSFDTSLAALTKYVPGRFDAELKPLKLLVSFSTKFLSFWQKV